MLFGDDGRRYRQTRTDRVFLEVPLKRQVQYLPASSAAHDAFFGKEGPGRKNLLRSGKRFAVPDMLLKKSRLPKVWQADLQALEEKASSLSGGLVANAERQLVCGSRTGNALFAQLEIRVWNGE